MSAYVPMLGQEEIPDTPPDDSGCHPRTDPKYLILPEYKDYFQYQPQLAKVEVEEPQIMYLFLIILLFGATVLLLRELIKKIQSRNWGGKK